MMLDRSYGVIPLKKIKGEWYTLLIKHQRSSFWGFPKGHADESEQPYETAAREIFEETGLTIKNLLINEPLSENYRFRAHGLWIDKTVVYFIAEVNEGEVVLQHVEVEESVWVPLKEADQKVTFDQAKDLCRQTCKLVLG
jgi:bis(5'-nucleosidyl)-tetraphosphatase